jgi:hypothetical protein
MGRYFKLLAAALAAARAGVGAFAGPRPRLAVSAVPAALRPRTAVTSARRGLALGAAATQPSARGAGAAFYARHVAPLRARATGAVLRLATFALLVVRFALRPSLAYVSSRAFAAFRRGGPRFLGLKGPRFLGLKCAVCGLVSPTFVKFRSARAAAGALPADVLRMGPAAGQNTEAISAAQKWGNLGVCFVFLGGLYIYQNGHNLRETKRIREAQAKILEHERKYFTDDDDDDDDKDKKDGKDKKKDGKDGDKPKAGGDAKAKASSKTPPPRPERKNVPSPFKAGPPGAPKPKPRGR